jgi:hypothetical protein
MEPPAISVGFIHEMIPNLLADIAIATSSISLHGAAANKLNLEADGSKNAALIAAT